MEKNILKSEQLGFVAGNRTSDAHIILHRLIQSYCIKKGRNIFACFVDFKKLSIVYLGNYSSKNF